MSFVFEQLVTNLNRQRG